MKYILEGNYIEAHIDENCYYCTNKAGDGLFFVDSAKNTRRQIEGTAQFSVRGIADKKAKIRRYIKQLCEV